MNGARLFSGLAFSACLSFLLAGCEVFLPARGGAGQPCVDLPDGGGACRRGLVCIENKCQEPGGDGGSDGANAFDAGDGSDQGADPGADADGGSDGANAFDAGDGGDQGADPGADAGDDPGGDRGANSGADAVGDPGADAGGDFGGDFGFDGFDGGDGPIRCSDNTQCGGTNYNVINLCEAGVCRQYPLNSQYEMCTDGIGNKGMQMPMDFGQPECGGGSNPPCNDVDGDGYIASGGNCGGPDCDDSASQGMKWNPGVIEYGNLCNESNNNDCDSGIGSSDRSCDISLDYSDHQDAWRWEHPLPQGNHLNSVWAINGSDVWAAGNAGMLMNFDGQRWKAVRPPAGAEGNDWVDVWAYPAPLGKKDVVYLVDDESDVYYRNFEGAWTKITELDAPTITDVWGIHPNKVYAVGYAGTAFIPTAVWFEIREGNPSQIVFSNPADGISLMKVFGIGFGEAWAAGYRTSSTDIVLFKLISSSSAISVDLVDIGSDDAGCRPTGLWVGASGVVWVGADCNNDGKVFSNESGTFSLDHTFEGKPATCLSGITRGGQTTLWVGVKSTEPAILTKDSGGWSSQAVEKTVHAVHGSTLGDVWAVGQYGSMAHRDSASGFFGWRGYTSRLTEANLYGAAYLEGDVFAAGSGGVILRASSSTTWNSLCPGQFSWDFRDMAPYLDRHGGVRVLAVGQASNLVSLVANSCTNLGQVTVAGGDTIVGISCSGGTEDPRVCVATTSQGKILFCQDTSAPNDECTAGDSWVLKNDANKNLPATYAYNKDHFFVAGENYIAWMNTQLVIKQPSSFLRSAWGIGQIVLTVGDNGSIYSCDISSNNDCVNLSFSAVGNLRAIGGENESSVYAGGENGVLFVGAQDGFSPVSQPSSCQHAINDIIFVTSNNTSKYYLVGNSGSILSR